jgi:hypothetical protein
MRNQRSATVDVILNVFEQDGVDFELNGETNAIDIISPAQKQRVKAVLFNAFKTKQVAYKPSFQYKVDNDTELNKYIGGLINNWLRKAPELNGGQKYEPKNPGSRAGSGDAQIRELKKLLKKVAGTEHESKVQEAIQARIAEIKPEAQVTIDASLLPEGLQDLV